MKIFLAALSALSVIPVVAHAACSLKLNTIVAVPPDDPTGGPRINLCCGVNSIWAAELLSGWQLGKVAAETPITAIRRGSFNLTWCLNGSTSTSWPEELKDGCQRAIGDSIDLSRVSIFTRDQWFIFCYNYTFVGETCRECSLVYVCPDVACKQSARWFWREARDLTNSSITFVYHMASGIPFTPNVVTKAYKSGSSSKPTFERTVPGDLGKLVNVSIANMEANTPYLFSTCSEIPVPATFLQREALNASMPNNTLFCQDNVTYRTLDEHPNANRPSFIAAPEPEAPNTNTIVASITTPANTQNATTPTTATQNATTRNAATQNTTTPNAATQNATTPNAATQNATTQRAGSEGTTAKPPTVAAATVTSVKQKASGHESWIMVVGFGLVGCWVLLWENS